ncbi:hypothetical protein KR074_007242, partial [Drosophila pseudoananassae]
EMTKRKHGHDPGVTGENTKPADPSEAVVEEPKELAGGETETEAEPEAETSSPAKPNGGRKRKRYLYNAIRGQMEFYFGDANLSKDRFLRRYVDQDPYVPLEIFLSFNKIKNLTLDVGQIAKSLGNSELLELDESGLKVKRKTKLPVQREVNDKTLYVEALPANATHDWLKEVFSRYGPVAYVSLPHYPGTKKIKEFAFIEFEKSSSVEKAVKAFTQIQGVLAMDTDPSDLASIKSFQQQQQPVLTQEQHPQQEETSPDDPPKRNLKREATDKNKEELLDVKRAKLEAVEQPEETSTAEETDASITDAEATAEASEGERKEDSKDGEDTSKKRRRKRKKKAVVDKPNIDPSALELKVLPKTSWSSLRNKYLNLQRRLVSEAKSKLWREQHPYQQQHQHPITHHANPPQPEVTKEDDTTSSEVLSDGGGGDPVVETGPIPTKRRKTVHKMNMNFYGAGGGETTKSEEPSQERTPLFKYEPGLIVECALLEPCTSVKEFKADMRQYPEIKYVDIKEGEQVAQLRLSTPQGAEELVRQLNCAERQLKILRGQAEALYWRKIEQDRETKLSKKVRVQQKRGREKVSKLLGKHIKFDDGDDGEAQVASIE